MDPDISIALLVLRVVLGLTLAAHGSQKLFGWWNGPGLAGFGGWLGSMGVRSPKLAALGAALGEFVGGLLLAVGLLTPLAACTLIAVMVVAVFTVHIEAGFFSTGGGYEFNLLIIASAVTLAITGPGEYSIDDVLDLTGPDWSGWEWGVGVLLAAILAGGSALVTRKHVEPAPAGD